MKCYVVPSMVDGLSTLLSTDGRATDFGVRPVQGLDPWLTGVVT